MYRVLKTFRDLQDGRATKTGTVYHRYTAGDTYPREGYEPSPERIAELAGRGNRMGYPLIEKIGGAPVEEAAPAPAEEVVEVEETAADLDGMLKKDLVAKAESMGIDVPSSATKADIIAMIKAQ